MPDTLRRRLIHTPVALALGAAGGGLAPAAWARAPLPARADSPQVGVDPAVLDSGLAGRWGQALRRDLGWAAQWTRLDSPQVLAQLEQGQIDVGLFFALPQADQLLQQGLIHDRRALARTEALLVGPPQDLAGIRAEHDPALALRQVLAAQAAGAARWAPPPPGSALAVLATQLCQGLDMHALGRESAAVGTAAAAPAYRLLTATGWARLPASAQAASKVWLRDSPALVLSLHAARSFRARHPGGKLLLDWLQGPVGNAGLRASAPVWRPAKG